MVGFRNGRCSGSTEFIDPALNAAKRGAILIQRLLAFARQPLAEEMEIVNIPKAIDNLMPLLSFAEVAGESQPPVAERLLSSNALRQQRFRERRAAALHNATEPLRVADVTGSNGGEGAP